MDIGVLAQHPDGIFQPFERQRKHAVVHQLLDDADTLAILPNALRFWVDPRKFREGVHD